MVEESERIWNRGGRCYQVADPVVYWQQITKS